MIRRSLLLIVGCLICGWAKAQHQQLFDGFRKEAGDQAEMFVGKVEAGYPSTIYTNHPYWLSGDFLPGDIVFDGRLYREVPLRFDAFLQQLVVSTPVKRSNVYVPMNRVERFTVEGTEYSRRNGEFMAILYSSPRMELVKQMRCVPSSKVVDNIREVLQFVRKEEYLLIRDGVMYRVDKLKSVRKLFPEHKKELKQFAKKHNLDFGTHHQSSLTTIVKYADELLVKPVN